MNISKKKLIIVIILLVIFIPLGIDFIIKSKFWWSPAKMDNNWKYTYKFAKSKSGLISKFQIFNFKDKLSVYWNEHIYGSSYKNLIAISANNGESWKRYKFPCTARQKFQFKCNTIIRSSSKTSTD